MMREDKKIDLQRKDLQIVQQILSAHVPGRPVYVFGSRATGRARRASDLDLVVGGPDLSIREHALLDEAFEESDLPMCVDVVPLAQAKGIFRKRIEREWVPLPGFEEDANEAAAA